MDYKINCENAKNSLLELHKYFSKTDMTSKAEVLLPENIKYGSIEHYKYLFYSCMLNYGMKSSVLHESLMKLYCSNPLLFSPEYICKTYVDNYGALADILRSFVHVRYPNQCAKNWFSLSQILYEQYNGNPKELFVGKNTYYDCQAVIFKLKGYGQKTGGLLLRMLIDNELLSPVDGIAEIPIDRHDIDLCIWLGVITGLTSEDIKKNKKVIEMLSTAWVKVSNELNISPSIADQYLWIIGSQFCAKNQCILCPLNTQCRKKKGDE